MAGHQSSPEKHSAGVALAADDVVPSRAADLSAPVRLSAGGLPILAEGGFASPFVGDFDGDGKKDLRDAPENESCQARAERRREYLATWKETAVARDAVWELHRPQHNRYGCVWLFARE